MDENKKQSIIVQTRNEVINKTIEYGCNYICYRANRGDCPHKENQDCKWIKNYKHFMNK